MVKSRVLTPEQEWHEYLPQVLAHVRNGRVRWNPDRGDGRFEWADGRLIGEFPVLIVLWKARMRGLVRVTNTGVLLTNKGAAR
jgi:hypothetical protein